MRAWQLYFWRWMRAGDASLFSKQSRQDDQALVSGQVVHHLRFIACTQCPVSLTWLFFLTIILTGHRLPFMRRRWMSSFVKEKNTFQMENHCHLSPLENFLWYKASRRNFLPRTWKHPYIPVCSPDVGGWGEGRFQAFSWRTLTYIPLCSPDVGGGGGTFSGFLMENFDVHPFMLTRCWGGRDVFRLSHGELWLRISSLKNTPPPNSGSRIWTYRGKLWIWGPKISPPHPIIGTSGKLW